MSPKALSPEARQRAGRTADAEAAILNLIETLIGGWNAHDAKIYASSFAEDADYVTVVGHWWRGRAENIDRHEEVFRGRFAHSRVRSTGVSLRFIRPDVAVAHLQWEMTGDRGPDGRGIPLRRGIFTFLASERLGRWQFDAAQNTDILVA